MKTPHPVLRAARGAVLLTLTLALTGCTAFAALSDEEQAPSDVTAAAAEETETPTPREPLTLEQLLSADVPSLCEHAPGTLVDGVLPGIDRTDGIVRLSAAAAMTDGSGSDPLSLAAINPAPADGDLAALAVFVCDRGGVTWPNVLVGYDVDLNIIGTVAPAELTRGPSDAMRDLVWHDDQTVTFDWTSHYPGEANCCGTLTLAGTVAYDPATAELTLMTPDVIEAANAAGAYFTAIQNQDWATVTDMTLESELATNISQHEHSQHVLTQDWSADKNAICLPVDHELHSGYTVTLFDEYNADFYCMPGVGYYDGRMQWQPGLFLGHDDTGTWLVNGVVIYMGA